MRVLFLQRQPCIRALKYGSALRAKFPDIRLAFAYQGTTLSDFYGTGDDYFEQWAQLDGQPPRDLQQAITAFRPDVIHSHNLPDSLTVLALDVTEGKIPIIHDVHDFQSLRQTIYEDGFPGSIDPIAEEKRAIEEVNAPAEQTEVV